MKKVICAFSFIIVFIHSSSSTLAHPKINEVSPIGSDDWVEVYLPSGEATTDLSHYRLRDSSKTNKVDLSSSLSPGGFYIANLKNKLNNSGDTVKLIFINNGAEEVIDEVTYGKSTCLPVESQTVGKRDQTGEWVILKVATKGVSNSVDFTSCSLEEPTADKVVLTPTQTPQIVLTVDSPLPTSTPVAPTLEPSYEVGGTPAVLAEASTSAVVDVPLDVDSIVVEAPRSPLGTFFIGLGIVCIILSAVLFLRTFKKRYNEKHAPQVE